MPPFSERQLLMIPGPTPVPPRVLRALSRQVISHRGPEYRELMHATTTGLQRVFQTEHEVITYPASGTGAMESALVNLFSPGDTILSLITGPFGARWAEIAEAHGLNVIRHELEWGEAATKQNCELRIANCELRIDGVLLTQNETVSGVTNDVRGIAELVRHSLLTTHHSPLLLVDAISGLGAIDLPMDEWGADVVVTGSQKALMTPPGLSFVAIGPRAWERHASARLPKFYWDWSRHRAGLASGENPYTPAVNLLFGLREALTMILEEIGLRENFARHDRLGRATRAGVQALGLRLFARDEAYASNAVTTVLPPDGLEVAQITKAMRERFNVTLAGGTSRLNGKVFRIGHVGYFSETDILATLSALGAVLHALGACDDATAGVGAALEAFART